MTNRTQTWAMIVASTAATALLAGTSLTAQAPPPARPQPPNAAAQGRAGRGPMGMTAERQKMMAEMGAAEKRLDALVATMNAAKGGDTIEHVTAVLNELVAQHKAMHRRMMEGGMMQGGMMGGPPPAAPAPAAAPPAGHEQHHE